MFIGTGDFLEIKIPPPPDGGALPLQGDFEKRKDDKKAKIV